MNEMAPMMPPHERQRLFLDAANVTERRTKDIVRLMAAETGTGGAFSMFQIKWAVDLLRQSASWAYLPVGEVLPSDTPGRFAMAVRKPLGVVAGFTPWNGAFSLAWRTVVLPMVFGNTVVLKPSEEAPLSAGLLLAEILEEAGFPAGAMNVVTHAPSEAGAVADVFFESPMLVLRDADLDNAVNTTAFSAFFHQGQICMNARKVLVERSIHDEFVERLAAKVRTIQSGDPAVAGTVIGPLINDRALHSVTERVQDAIAQGARLVVGGTAEGRVYAPTILTHVPDTAPVCHEETFGPVLVIQAVDDPEQAFLEASNTRYGLCASIMTGDHDRGLDLAQRLNCGMVHVNGATMASEPSLPNGGVKDSGWGRSGHYAIEDFTEVRLITMTRGRGRYPI